MPHRKAEYTAPMRANNIGAQPQKKNLPPGTFLRCSFFERSLITVWTPSVAPTPAPKASMANSAGVADMFPFDYPPNVVYSFYG